MYEMPFILVKEKDGKKDVWACENISNNSFYMWIGSGDFTLEKVVMWGDYRPYLVKMVKAGYRMTVGGSIDSMNRWTPGKTPADKKTTRKKNKPVSTFFGEKSEFSF